MPRVADFADWATLEDGLRTYLGVPTPEEASKLQLWLEAAVEAADLYIEETQWMALPTKVKLGIYKWVEYHRSGSLPGGGAVKKVKTHELEQEYFSAGSNDSVLEDIAREYWYDQKKRPWLV